MKEENQHYIYEHWRPDTGVVFYVGMGKNGRAWQIKTSRNRRYRFLVKKLERSGLSVEVRIIEKGLSVVDAFSKEIERIAYWLERGANLVNMTLGGDGMANATPELRKRISEKVKAKYAAMTPEERKAKFSWNVGRKHSLETREKVRVASTGRKHSLAAKEKIRMARKAAGIPPHVRAAQIAAATGRKRAPFKESTIAKMRIAAAERERIKRDRRATDGKPYLHSNCKTILCIEDGITFSNAVEAAKHYGIHRSTITGVCIGLRGRKTAGGKHFKYVEAA